MTSSSPYFTRTRWIASMRKIVRRLAISVVALQAIDACLEAIDIVAQRIHIGGKTIDLVTTGRIAAFFLEILADIGAHRRSGSATPVTDAAGEVAKGVRGAVADDAR